MTAGSPVSMHACSGLRYFLSIVQPMYLQSLQVDSESCERRMSKCIKETAKS